MSYAAEVEGARTGSQVDVEEEEEDEEGAEEDDSRRMDVVDVGRRTERRRGRGMARWTVDGWRARMVVADLRCQGRESGSCRLESR